MVTHHSSTAVALLLTALRERQRAISITHQQLPRDHVMVPACSQSSKQDPNLLGTAIRFRHRIGAGSAPKQVTESSRTYMAVPPFLVSC